MARHAEITQKAGIAVYSCDPHSPWQRGSNKNTKGLIRQYLPEGADLSGHSQEQLDAIALQLKHASADELNRQLSREREQLVYASLIAIRRNLDPADFMDNRPFRPLSRAKETVTPITKGAKTAGRKPRG